MMNEEAFLACFEKGDVAGARECLKGREEVEDPIADERVTADPLLRACVARNDGHCYKAKHLEIAELLLSETVIRFRDALLADDQDVVDSMLKESPQLAGAEFTAGRGIAQPIHHWQSIPVAKLLVDTGADVNALTTVHEGETPLNLKVRFGTLDHVRFLLEQGADPNRRPVMCIASESMSEVIELLQESGWDIRRGAMLHHDANHGFGKRIQTWLEYGADPNAKDEQSRTALHLLAMQGTGEAGIRALVEAGCDVAHRDAAGKTALDYAQAAEKQVALRVLKELGG